MNALKASDVARILRQSRDERGLERDQIINGIAYAFAHEFVTLNPKFVTDVFLERAGCPNVIPASVERELRGGK